MPSCQEGDGSGAVGLHQYGRSYRRYRTGSRTTAPTQRQHKRRALRERAEIFSLRLSPKLRKRSRSRETRAGADQAQPPEREAGCIAPEGPEGGKPWRTKKDLDVVLAQRGFGHLSWLARDILKRMSRPLRDPVDRLLTVADHALRALTSTPSATRPTPAAVRPDRALDPSERRLLVADAREPCRRGCAQALTAPGARHAHRPCGGGSSTPRAKKAPPAWTSDGFSNWRQAELAEPALVRRGVRHRPVAGRSGDATSLGFMVETSGRGTPISTATWTGCRSRRDPRASAADEGGRGWPRHPAERAGAGRLPLPSAGDACAARVMTTTATSLTNGRRRPRPDLVAGRDRRGPAIMMVAEQYFSCDSNGALDGTGRQPRSFDEVQVDRGEDLRSVAARSASP